MSWCSENGLSCHLSIQYNVVNKFIKNYANNNKISQSFYTLCDGDRGNQELKLLISYFY